MQPQCVKTFIRYPNGVRIRQNPCDTEPSDRETPGGICFATSEPLAPGATVQVSLDTPSGSELITMKVAWCEAENDGFLTAGRLLDDGDACRARLAAQLCLIHAYHRDQCAGGRELDEETAALEWIARYAHQVPSIT